MKLWAALRIPWSPVTLSHLHLSGDLQHDFWRLMLQSAPLVFWADGRSARWVFSLLLTKQVMIPTTQFFLPTMVNFMQSCPCYDNVASIGSLTEDEAILYQICTTLWLILNILVEKVRSWRFLTTLCCNGWRLIYQRHKWLCFKNVSVAICIEIVKIWSVTQISWACFCKRLFKKIPIPGSFLGFEVLSFNSYPY